MSASRIVEPNPTGTGSPLDAQAPAKRRDVLKLSLTALPLAAAAARAAKGPDEPDEPLGPGDVSSFPPGPPTTPFLEAMPLIPELKARPLTDPAFARVPTMEPNRSRNPATNLPYEGRGDAHQLRAFAMR